MIKTNRGEGAMTRLAAFIVNKRNLFFLLFAVSAVFCVVSKNWVSVENDLVAYLPKNTDTVKGLDVMEEEFVTYGSAEIMVDNITYAKAEKLADEIGLFDGVLAVDFDDTSAHFNQLAALYTVTFKWDEDDERCLEALAHLEEYLSGYDVFVSTDLGNQLSETIDHEVGVIMIYVAIIVVIVLIFTTKSYADVLVLIITFLVAMILNSGTNFLLGTISFVSNSVTSILQLALSLDYAVILINHFREERKNLPVEKATVTALAKAIPEISASSLTTMGGLFAMVFMQFKIGSDMGICLIKAIFFSLITAFLLMPGLIVLFGPLMTKTEHRSFIPKVSFVGKFAYATKKAVPILFVCAFAVGAYFSRSTPYVYGYGVLTPPRQNETQKAEELIEETFSSESLLAFVVPGKDYTKEAALIAEVESMDEINSVVGLANVEAADGYTLTDSITPRQFSEVANIDYEVAEILYAAYAADAEEYGRIVGGLYSYSIPFMDIFGFAYDMIQNGYVTLDSEQMETLAETYDAIVRGREQLEGENYDRILIYLNLVGGSEETYDFAEYLRELGQSYYESEDTVYLVGDITSEMEFRNSFEIDNVVVAAISVIIVLIVLLFTFMSVGMPILLILIIEGSIMINFSIPAITGSNVFFMSYLVVSAIQMGANIDYAIVISNRFLEVKDKMPKRDAIIDTMNFSFSTILTSGLILVVSGMLIGQLTSENTISGIGQALGRGTIISIILVMFVLPQVLLLGEKVIDKTRFNIKVGTGRTELGGREEPDGLKDDEAEEGSADDEEN